MQVRFGQGLDFARFSTSVKNLIYRRLAPTIVLSLDFLSSFNSSPGPTPNISSLHQINQGFFTQKKTKVSAEKPGAKEPPYPVESPSPPALPPCSARNAPASSSRPAGHTENPNVPRLALSTWSPRRGVVENIWRWATNLFMVWNGMIYEIYLGVECHIYATKLYATYMPHSYIWVWNMWNVSAIYPLISARTGPLRWSAGLLQESFSRAAVACHFQSVARLHIESMLKRNWKLTRS